MAKNISTININAPVEKVWNALTNAELVKLWQYGSDLITTWEVGTSIKFSTAWQDKIFEQWGIVLDIQPNELIRYSLFAAAPGREDIPENYFIMNYVLTNEGATTKLEIIQEDDRRDAKQEEPQGEENPVLKMLKEVAEKE